MKRFLASIFLMVMAVSGSAVAEDKPALYAIKFHADWCGSCKAIAPELEKARGKHDLDNQSVLFVTLDLTNGTTRNQAELMADALGIGEFFDQNNNKTGFILLVNSQSGETVGKITKADNADAIAKAITSKL